MTDDEVAAYERRAAEREDGRPPDDPRTEQSVHPTWWLDYGKTVVKTRRTSLIVDPPDGRIPPLTPEAQKRPAARRAAARARGPADSYEDRSLFERCITRGVPEGMLPGPYNNNMQLLQAPGYVMIFTEMIHDARIIPTDGRPHAARTSASGWATRAGGGKATRWSSTPPTSPTRPASAAPARTCTWSSASRGSTPTRSSTASPSRIPTTWTRPWTVAFPMVKTDEPIYEYACHEGNYGLVGILVGRAI